MNNRYQAIIVGSGLAGMAVADLLSRHGLSVLVVDDNAHTGGQLLRKPIYGGSRGRRFEPDRLKRRGMQLAEKLGKGKVQFLKGTQVLGGLSGTYLAGGTTPGRCSGVLRGGNDYGYRRA